MERFIFKKLLDWKNSLYRKPLILKGVRQVGKTWILKEFGRRYYEKLVAYLESVFNFTTDRGLIVFHLLIPIDALEIIRHLETGRTFVDSYHF